MQAVVVHGGVGAAVTEPLRSQLKVSMQTAVEAAWSALEDGAVGEAAVVAALATMEDDQLLNAGYGSHPNQDGEAYMDVGLMRGTGDFVSFMNMSRLRFPSRLALDSLHPGRALARVWSDRLLEELVGQDPAKQKFYGLVPKAADLVSQHAWQVTKSQQPETRALTLTQDHGTVGCVVRDKAGKLFAGTSTGGILGKPHGRVGDSPIIGAGVYAEDGVIGLSMTGSGEAILGSSCSGFIINQFRQLSMNDARFAENGVLAKLQLTQALKLLQRRYPGRGAGAVILAASGQPIVDFCTPCITTGWRYESVAGQQEFFGVLG